jgi:hypothetical protein
VRPPIIIATLAKDRGEALRVALYHLKGADVLDIRVCVELTRSCGVLVPTARGVSVAMTMLPALIAALGSAETKARELGLIGEAAQ